MLTKILSGPEDELVREERQVLARLRTALVRFDAAAGPAARARESIEQLDELFLLVIVGEFNAGKSAFINALVGSKMALEGVTPTTAQINVLQYGDTHRAARSAAPTSTSSPRRRAPPRHPHRRHAGHQRDHPRARGDHRRVRPALGPRAVRDLRRSAVHRDRARVPRAVRDWGKKVVIVINKIDILDGERQVDGVRGVRADSARALLGFSPEIFPVSARLALRAKQGEPTALGGEPVRGARAATSATTLDEPGRVRLKLLNPLGVGAAVAARYASAVQERPHCSRRISPRWTTSSGQLAMYQEDMLASSGSACPTSTGSCSRWRTAARSTSTTPCASAG